ncbi:MAG: Abortive infection protein [Solirubrobacterales bacterium]|nr:Abortive infection protein [Solirubrobacterales bacterium]
MDLGPGRAPPTGGALPHVTWGPGRTLGALGAMLLALFAEVALIAAILDPELESLGATLVLQAALAGTLVGTAFVAANTGGARASAAQLGLRRPRGKFVRATLTAYVGYFVCALAIAALLQPEQEDVTRELGVDEGALGVIVAGLLIVGVAPFTEEVFFRGFMFAGMRRAMPFAAAALIPAVIWGLFHYTGPDTWGVVVQLSVFGLWLSWLYERTGSIWPPIAVHAFNNAIAFTLLTA